MGTPLPVASDSVRAADESVLRDPKHRAAVVALAAVLALDGADRTALGALAPALKSEFGVGNTAIGLLASVFAIVGALAIIPIGILTDRTRRITILVVCIAIWCLAMGVAAAAMSFAVLFAARVSLGVLSAAGGPPVTSLVGDLFPADVRGRVLGWVKSGELVGAGAGFLVAGVVVWLTSWRVCSWCWPSWAWRSLGPSRACRSRAAAARTTFRDPAAAASTRPRTSPSWSRSRARTQRGRDPRGRRVRAAARPAIEYVLHVHTVVMIIIASALGDVFFTALQVFGVLFLVDQFGISASAGVDPHPLVGVGGFVGVLAGGRLGDC